MHAIQRIDGRTVLYVLDLQSSLLVITTRMWYVRDGDFATVNVFVGGGSTPDEAAPPSPPARLPSLKKQGRPSHMMRKQEQARGGVSCDNIIPPRAL